MTNLEAIKAKLGYPLADNAFTAVLEDRGLTTTGTYAKCSAFELAYADSIMLMLTAPNVSEGGYSVSQTDKASLLALANGIYARNNVASLVQKPTARFVQKW